MRCLLLLALVSCGEAPQSSEASLSPTSTSTGTGISTAVQQKSGVVSNNSTSRFISWTLSSTENRTNKDRLHVRLSTESEINDVEVGPQCGSWKFRYPYNSNLDVEFTERNTFVTIAIRLIAKDGAVSDCKTIQFTHDDRPPSANRIKINDDAPKTKSLTVSLKISSVDAESMYVTNNKGCTYGGYWETYKTSKEYWSLAQSNAENAVYAKFKDASGNESECVEAKIVHDNLVPTNLSVKINFTGSQTVSVSLFGVGAEKVYVGDRCTPPNEYSFIDYTTSVSRTLSGTGNSFTIYAVFVDDLGNESACVSDTLTIPSKTLTYYWYEGRYYTGACQSSTLNGLLSYSRSVLLSPFANVSQSSYSCTISGSGNSYTCDYKSNLKNCTKFYSSPKGLCMTPTEYYCTSPI